MSTKIFLPQFYIPLAIAIIGIVTCTTAIKAQESSRTQKTRVHTAAIITRYDVKKNYRKRFAAALQNYVAGAQRYQNNIMAELYVEQDSPTVFWIIERWTNNNAYRNMRVAASSVAVATLAITALTKPATGIAVTDLEPLSAHEWRKTPGSHDEPITIMLFVDAKPGTEDRFTNVYHTAMPQFRSESGVINYQLSRFNDDRTRFVTYEKFRNEAAFQYHLNFPPIKPVIDYLTTSIRKQPFQLGLHRLKEI